MAASYNNKLSEAISTLASLAPEAEKAIEQSVRSTAKIVIYNRFNSIIMPARKLGDPELIKVIGEFVGLIMKQVTGKDDALNNIRNYFDRYDHGPERLRDIAMVYVDLLEYKEVFQFQEDCVRKGQSALAQWGRHLIDTGKLKEVEPTAIYNLDGTPYTPESKKYGKITAILPGKDGEKNSDKKDEKQQ